MVSDVSTNPPDLLLEQVLQTSLDAIVICEAIRDEADRIVDFQIIRCNPAASAMTGFSMERMLTETMLTLDPDGYASGIFELYRQVAETGLPTHTEHHFADADTWMVQSLARYNDGVLGSWADITPLKRAELVNQQQTALLQSVLDSSANAIVAFSAVRTPITSQIIDFRYVAHNEANRRAMNQTDDEIIGRTMLEFFPEMARNGLFDRFADVVQSGNSIRFEHEFREEGWSGWFGISATKWSDGIVLTLVDINASKKHQQEVEQANRNLTHANDNLYQFARVASHDLQEPLRKIMSFGDVLHDQFATELGDSGADLVARMQSAARRMSDLVRDVVTYSRTSTHRQPMRSADLSGIISDVCAEFSNSFDLVNMQVAIGDLPAVRCDRTQLQQLFSNLIANALKFRDISRPPVLQISYRTLAGTVHPDLLNPAVTYYEINVADNGIGFDAKYTDQIFQVFQRLHNRQQYPGTGVGLAICRRIVENHHGAITATAIPGEGATFRVYLPK